MRIKKVTLANVKSTLKKNGAWSGWFCPSKSYPNIGHPFNTAIEVTIYSLDDLEKKVDNFQYYNCNSELGNRVHYYVVE